MGWQFWNRSHRVFKRVFQSGGFPPRKARSRRLTCEPLEQRQLLAVTWHVDISNAGDPLEDGTATHPFDQIQDAINAAAPTGDTVSVAAGTYAEHVILNKELRLGGNSSSDTTLQGYIEVGNPGSGATVIENLTVDIDTGGESYGINFASASSVTVQDVQFVYDDGDNAIRADSGSVLSGIKIGATGHGNVFQDNSVSSRAKAISMDGDALGARFTNLAIEHNEFKLADTGWGIIVEAANGVGDSSGLKIADNDFMDQGDVGVLLIDNDPTGTNGILDAQISANDFGDFPGWNIDLDSVNELTDHLPTAIDISTGGVNTFHPTSGKALSGAAWIGDLAVATDLYPLVQDALDNAAADGTVQVAPGDFRENLTIDKSLTLQGAQGGVNFHGGGSNGITITGPNSVKLKDLRVTDAAIAIDADDTDITKLELVGVRLDGNSSGGVVSGAEFSFEATSGTDAITVDSTGITLPGNDTIGYSVHTKVNVSGGGDDDKLIVDFSGGDPVPTPGLFYDGGIGDNDSLDFVNVPSTFTTHTYGQINNDDRTQDFAGSVVLNDGDDSTIAYTGLEPLTNDGTPNDVIFNLPTSSDIATLADLGGGKARLDAATIEQTDFAYPIAGGSITINMGDGDDTLTITSLALNANTDLLLDGQVGNDTVNFSVPAPGGLTSVDQLLVTADTITVNGPVNAASNVLLDAALGDVILNADVASGTGHISIVAGNDVDQNADIITGGTGTILVSAGGEIDMQAGTSISTGGGNVRLEAGGESDIRLGLVNAGTGAVSLSAERDILDNNGGTLNVQASTLAMVADSDQGGAGQIGRDDAANGTPLLNANAIDTQVAVLAAAAADGIYVLESDGVRVDDTGAITVNQVNFNSTTDLLTGRLSNLRTTDNGPIKLVTLTGDLTVDEGVTNPADLVGGVVAHGLGNVLLEARVGDVILNADVTSGTGHISIVAGNDVDQNANIITGGTGTILVRAGGEIDMQAGTSISTGGGNVRLEAGGESDIRLGLVNAGAGAVSLSAERNIVDNNGAAGLNVQAAVLAMTADSDQGGAGQIGRGDLVNAPASNDNAIDTQVTTLAALSAGGIYVLERDGVTVDDTEEIAVSQVNFNSTMAAVTNRLSDLRTTDNGPIKVVTLTGVLTVNEGAVNPADVSSGVVADGSGNVLLEARAGDVVLNAAIVSTVNHVRIVAGGDVDQNANISSGGAGTILVQASSGIDMSGASTKSLSGNIRLVASEGDILLGRVETNRAVCLLAERSILDGNGGGTLNIRANRLAMVADSDGDDEGQIGQPDFLNPPAENDNAIDTQVTTLAAASADGIYVLERDGVTVDDTAPITVNEVNFNSTTSQVMDRLSDVRTTDNGAIEIVTLGGDLTVNEGAANPVDVADGIVADGSGDVLLQAVEKDGNVELHADVRTTSGDIHIRAGDDKNLADETLTGDVTLHSNARVRTDSGNIGFRSGDGVELQDGSHVEAPNGTVTLSLGFKDTVEPDSGGWAEVLGHIQTNGTPIEIIGDDGHDRLTVDFDSSVLDSGPIAIVYDGDDGIDDGDYGNDTLEVLGTENVDCFNIVDESTPEPGTLIWHENLPGVEESDEREEQIDFKNLRKTELPVGHGIITVDSRGGLDKISFQRTNLLTEVHVIGGDPGPSGYTEDCLSIYGTADADRIVVLDQSGKSAEKAIGDLKAAEADRPSPVLRFQTEDPADYQVFRVETLETLHVLGQAGDDYLINDTGILEVTGTGSDDLSNTANPGWTPTGFGVNALLDGSEGDDTLVGGSVIDVAFGAGGLDVLWGREGDDYLFNDHAVSFTGPVGDPIVVTLVEPTVSGELADGGSGTNWLVAIGDFLNQIEGTKGNSSIIGQGNSLSTLDWLQGVFHRLEDIHLAIDKIKNLGWVPPCSASACETPSGHEPVPTSPCGTIGGGASTGAVPAAEDLGVVDFRGDLSDLDPSSGDLSYQFEAAHTGVLTVELGGMGGSAASSSLFTATGDPLSALVNGPGTGGTDYAVAAGRVYNLKISGTAADVDLRLTNLVTQDGAAVTVFGTERDDALEFELRNGYLVRINGTEYHFDDLAGVAETVSFDGGLGTDSARFRGSESVEAARFFTGTGEFFSGADRFDEVGFFVDAIAEHLTAHGGGGRDIASMYDSPGDDIFTVSPRSARLVGPGYSHTANDFQVNHGYATNRGGEDKSGGNDQAVMYDSAGNDKFKLDWKDDVQFFSKLYGSGFYNRAKMFEATTAEASGGLDVVRAFGSPGDDEFFLKKEEGRVGGGGYGVEYLGFDSVIAYAGNGHDIARFEDSAGDDVFRGRNHKSTMIGLDYDLVARAFEEVYAEAKNGGYDKAKLHDTAAGDRLLAEERGAKSWAQLVVDSDPKDPLYETLAFEFVRVYGSDVDDKVARPEEFDWLLLNGDWTDE